MYIKSRIGWQRLTKDEQLPKGDYYLITGTDINELTHTIDFDKSVYVSKERYDKDQNIQLKNGDIIVTKDGTIGKVAMVKGLDKPATLNSHLFVVRDLSAKVNNRFLLHILDSPLFKRFVDATKTGSTLTGLPQKTFVNFTYYLPTMAEQNNISSFLDTLDNTIALHQRGLDLLKQTKQSYLQKMFPKKGEDKPEIRFAGFTDAWEQRKAKELFIPKAEKNQPELPVLSVTQDHGVVYREQVGIDIKYDKATLKNYKVIHQGDFVISLRSFQGGFELSDKLGITSPAYTIFVPKNMDSQDNLFWKTKFKTFTFIESLKTVTFGIRDGKSISFSEFGDLKLFFPKNIEEQQKIGNFFKQLDDTIALHQRELDSLKEMKKSLLQQMFV
ncbi:restriction endonuclease subunit S [Enterococcus faecium]|nr:restriction endonuclease subunit S [Enterococcus faecium]